MVIKPKDLAVIDMAFIPNVNVATEEPEVEYE